MVSKPAEQASGRRMLGRCEIFEEIGSGGMATIHLGRLMGAGNFAKTVAVKRLHPKLTSNKEFTRMLLQEAHLVARIQHANVLPVLDLVEDEGELFIVMEYVEGEAFHRLMQVSYSRREPVPLRTIMKIMCGVLHGLHAAHEVKDSNGEHLGLVHRDVAPDNILVGVDGVTRLLDFGVAKALGRFNATGDGTVRGKLSYMTPEQVLGEKLDRRTDIFSATVVLWQAMTGCKLFTGRDTASMVHSILYSPIEAPSKVRPGLPVELDDIVLRGLDRNPNNRWTTAQQFALALEDATELATQHEVGNWVAHTAADRLAMLRQKVAELEAAPISNPQTHRTIELAPISSGATDPKAVETPISDTATPLMLSHHPQHRPRGGRLKMIGIAVSVVLVLVVSIIPLLSNDETAGAAAADGTPSTPEVFSVVSSATVATAASTMATSSTNSSSLPGGSSSARPKPTEPKLVWPPPKPRRNSSSRLR